MRRRLALAALLGLAAAPSTAAPVPGAPSIADFAKLAEIRDVRLSPSGKRLLIVRLGDKDRGRIEVRETAHLAEGGLAFDSAPAEIRSGSWLTDDLILARVRDRIEETRRSYWREFFVVFDAQGRVKSRLPSDAEVLGLDPTSPGMIFLAYSEGNGPRDVWRFDGATGRSTRLARGGERRFGFIVDRTGAVRISSIFNPDKYEVVFQARSAGEGDWRTIHVLSPRKRETWRPLGFLSADPDLLTILSDEGSDKTGLAEFSISSGAIKRWLYRRDDVDIDGAVATRDGKLIGANYVTDRRRTEWFDPASRSLSQTAERLLPGQSIDMVGPAADGARVIRASGPGNPGSFYLAVDGRLRALGSAAPQFKGKALATSEFRSIRARDGQTIPVFVTRPTIAPGALPLVILPHGGPWARDEGGWDEWAQMLAAQGYLVAQPEFRGSTGFGRAHWTAGDREWGGKMQDDLDDTVVALRSSHEADPVNAAMFGWSYGGYAALAATFRGNGLYRCAIAGAAVSDLDKIQALLTSDPYTRFTQKPTIMGPSPVKRLADATIPVLVIHGDEDDIVDVAQGRATDAALTSADKPHQYLEVHRLGHTSDRFASDQKLKVYEAITSWLRQTCKLE